MGGRVHPLKRSVSWVNSVQRQFLAYGPILFLVPVSEATWNKRKIRATRMKRAPIFQTTNNLSWAAVKIFAAFIFILFRCRLLPPNYFSVARFLFLFLLF